MKLVILMFAFLLLASCASVSDTQPKEYNTKEFDIWMGCKLKLDANGKKTVETTCGGNPQLFELLFLGLEMMAQKMGYFPQPSENDPMLIPLVPYGTQTR